MSSKTVVPGDKLGVIEEFEAGEGALTHDGIVRAASVGQVKLDLKKHVVAIGKVRQGTLIPVPGDSIIGKVESAQSSAANVLILSVNDKTNRGGFTGLALFKIGRPMGRGRQRRTTACKTGDLVRATVISDKNTIIHISLDGPRDGVIYAVCSICGGALFRANNSAKCDTCGNIEDRKLAPDFGNMDLKL
ncbi:MAG: exosome complex RNA-binding protein Csl4 [Thaumarchaeota archaeon]|nr:exosome complex RNA-binding protein Csl4 [Nitrososphaerota archaeon]